MIDQAVDVDLDSRYDLVLAVVDNRNIVIRGIGNVGKPAPDGDGIGTCAADDFSALNHLTDLETGFISVGHAVGGQVNGVNGHGFGCQRVADTGDFSAVPGIALSRFFGVVAIGVEGDEQFVEVLRRQVGQQRIVIHADVGDKRGVVVGAYGEPKGLPAGWDGGGDPAGCQIDPCQAEIAAVQDQKFICICVVQ